MERCKKIADHTFGWQESIAVIERLSSVAWHGVALRRKSKGGTAEQE
jgi:hypothetical protein